MHQKSYFFLHQKECKKIPYLSYTRSKQHDPTNFHRIINSITQTSWLPTTILLHRYSIPVRTTFLIHRSYRTHRALRNYRSPRLYSHQIAQPRTSIRRTRPLTWPARSILRHFSSSFSLLPPPTSPSSCLAWPLLRPAFVASINIYCRAEPSLRLVRGQN